MLEEVVNAGHGVSVSDDGTLTVITELVDKARETVAALRRDAQAADKEAALTTRRDVRRVMLQSARRCRYRADKIERQCDAIQRKG